MNRSPIRPIVAAIAAGMAVGAVLFSIVFVLNRGNGFATCTAMNGLGWAVPLVAGLIIGGVALMLLNGTRPVDDANDSSSGAASIAPCASCGIPIRDEWRLCPHCGELLECDVRSRPLAHGHD